MKMLFDNVLIKELDKKTKVLMPDKQARIPNKGVVVSVGPGDLYGYPEKVPTTVKPGDKVMFVRDRALEVTLAGATLYIVKERDVTGVISDEEAKD